MEEKSTVKSSSCTPETWAWKETKILLICFFQTIALTSISLNLHRLFLERDCSYVISVSIGKPHVDQPTVPGQCQLDIVKWKYNKSLSIQAFLHDYQWTDTSASSSSITASCLSYPHQLQVKTPTNLIFHSNFTFGLQAFLQAATRPWFASLTVTTCKTTSQHPVNLHIQSMNPVVTTSCPASPSSSLIMATFTPWIQFQFWESCTTASPGSPPPPSTRISSSTWIAPSFESQR